MRGRARGAGAAAAAMTVAAALLPESALAHGLVGRADLPIPEWLFGWAATVVLVASFLALAALWPSPRLEHAPERLLLALPRAVEILCGAVGVGLFAVVVYSGLAGSQSPTANLAPTTVYVLFWVGLVPLSVMLGDVLVLFSPWRALARGAGWLAGRIAGGGLPEPLHYPERLGRWPAAAGIAAFAWVELAYTDGEDPSTLAALAIAYAVVQLVGMSLYGIDRWTERADPFAVYFGLFARLSPLSWHDGALHLRRPLSGLAGLEPLPGTIPLLCVMIGATGFDGASEGPLWTSVAPHVQDAAAGLGASPSFALEIAFTVGLVVACLAIALLYRAGVAGMRTVRGGPEARDLAGRFVHSLVPIALAYVVAHYFSLLAYQGQATAYLVSDPLGDGADLFGTASAQIDYGVISATGIWYVQVAALVAGHVTGLVLAHDRALAVYARARDATRSQYWMLAVMVGFTSLGLYLLSASNA